MITGREIIAGVGAVVLIVLMGLTLALQGWRSNISEPEDWVSDIRAAADFLATGQIPDHGTLTSYRSYAPPGGAWLYVPGVLSFKDPRLIPVSVGVAVYLATTLTGVFLLARLYFGLHVAILSVSFYGLCQPALELASFGNNRSLPPFFIAIVYCICRWVLRSDPRFLAAAIVIWSMGLLLYMTLAPVAFSMLAVWFFWRPPVRLLPIAIALLVAIIIWFPYLRFESNRSFVDLWSQVMRIPLPALNANAFCDQQLAAAYSADIGQGPQEARLANTWLVRASTVMSWPITLEDLSPGRISSHRCSCLRVYC